MLKKKDLAKQFELIVQQEIIEHNKAISASNLAVKDLKTKIETISKEKDLIINALKNNLFKIETEMFNLAKDFNFLKQGFSKLCSDQKSLNESNSKKIRSIETSQEDVLIKVFNINKICIFLKETVSNLERDLSNFKRIMFTEIERIKTIFKQDLQSQKEEIINMPSGIEDAKDEFLKELEMHKVDKEGLFREIKVLKKTAFVNEKKIEQLYTEIKRMSKK